MQHADQVAYLERMLRMVRTNTRDDGPGLSHTPVEELLRSGALPARGRRCCSASIPIVVGFSAQLRKPGDFVVHNDTGQPILVARGTDGVLRAFLNVCRHRSASVEQKPCGANKRAFVCPYHGWSYDLTGRLVGITDGAAFGDVDKSKHGLRRLKVAEKYGLVWVVPTALEDGRGRRASTSTPISAPLQRRPRQAGTCRAGSVHSFGADPAAHELEAGDRHLPRALPLPLPASRHGRSRCSSTTSRPTSAWAATSRIGRRQAHAHRARGPAARRAGASSTTPSCSISSSPTRC